MKYVILKIKITEGVYKAFPYIFCEHDTHSVIAESMKHMLMREMKKDAIVHSAGFIVTDEFGDGFRCWRGSETLKIPKEEERCDADERIINHIDSTAGVIYA
jgi:hypothetical protein